VSRSRWENVLSVRPLVAILRGLRPEEAADIGQALVAAGILCAEVPLNSPNAPDSIAILKRAHGHKLMVGAGTVLSVQEVAMVAACGAELVVSPNINPAVIAAYLGEPTEAEAEVIRQKRLEKAASILRANGYDVTRPAGES